MRSAADIVDKQKLFVYAFGADGESIGSENKYLASPKSYLSAVSSECTEPTGVPLFFVSLIKSSVRRFNRPPCAVQLLTDRNRNVRVGVLRGSFVSHQVVAIHYVELRKCLNASLSRQ